jgi:hypothetical protein
MTKNNALCLQVRKAIMQLPAMVVAFSCRALNEMADDTRAVDFFSNQQREVGVAVGIALGESCWAGVVVFLIFTI